MAVEAASATRTEAVMQLVRQQIERRVLTPGARLPSVRAMAEQSGFSKSTVVEAYERLVAEGTIRSRPGSGFYVAAPLAPLALAEVGAAREREIDPMWMLRQSLETRAGALMPGCGWLPESWLAEEPIRRGLRRLARAAGTEPLVSYAPPAGSPPLRQLIARRLFAQGVEAGPDQILLTDSGTHAVDLVLRFLIEPGATVLVDDPCYFNFHALLRAHRAKVIGVPMTPTGPDTTAFAQAIAEHRPRLYLTNSAVHNPTGATLAAPVAHRLLKLAEAGDVVVVEDDIFADFEEAPAPRLAAFDGLERVIRIGSFSKSLSAAVRLGYIAARGDWIESLTDLRIATGLSGSPVAAELVTTALTDGSYRRHMESVRARLAVSRRRSIARLRSVGIEPWTEPQAGLFVWGRLPEGSDAAELARRAREENILLAPGNVFSVGQTAGQFMRFNVAMLDDERIFATLSRLLGAKKRA